MDKSRKSSRRGSVSCTPSEIDGGCWWGVAEGGGGRHGRGCVVVVVVALNHSFHLC